MTVALLSGLVLTAGVSASLTAVVIPLLKRAHVIDVPGDRSLHQRPVPRGGGLAIVLAVSLTAWVAGLVALHRFGAGAVVARLDIALIGLTTVLAFALVGLAEDLLSLAVRTRLIL